MKVNGVGRHRGPEHNTMLAGRLFTVVVCRSCRLQRSTGAITGRQEGNHWKANNGGFPTKVRKVPQGSA